MKVFVASNLILIALACSQPVSKPQLSSVVMNSKTNNVSGKNIDKEVSESPSRDCAPLDNACFALKFKAGEKCLTQYSTNQDGVRMLTNDEIRNSLSSAFEMDFSERLKDLPRRTQGSKFDNAMLKSAIGQTMVDNWLEISTNVANAFLNNATAAGKYITCNELSKSCSDEIISNLVPAIWRSPVKSQDLEPYNKLFTSSKSHQEAVLRTVTVMLNDPRFLYKPELNSSDEVISNHELASRISYFMLRSPPDAILMAKAADGSLASPDVRRSEIARLQALPQAEAAFREFMTEWLMLTNIDNLQIAGENVEPAAKRKDVLDRLTALVFKADNDVRLAFGKEGENIFTMPGLLGSLSASAITSPVKRGIYFSSRILCRAVPPPPGNAGAFKAETLRFDSTPRERLIAHEDNASCAICHATVDPIGLGLETFDTLGRTRVQYADINKKIDASGSMRLDGKDFYFADAAALLNAIGNSEDLPACLTVTLSEYALGSEPEDANSCELSSIQQKFAASGYKWKVLVESIIESPSFSRKIVK